MEERKLLLSWYHAPHARSVSNVLASAVDSPATAALHPRNEKCATARTAVLPGGQLQDASSWGNGLRDRWLCHRAVHLIHACDKKS